MISQTKPAAYLEALKTATPVGIVTNIEPIESAPSASSQKNSIFWLILALGLIGGCAVIFNQIHQQQKPE